MVGRQEYESTEQMTYFLRRRHHRFLATLQLHNPNLPREGARKVRGHRRVLIESAIYVTLLGGHD